MRSWALLAVLLALVGMPGCCKERDETKDDVRRFGLKSREEVEKLRIDVNRFAESNLLIGKNIPFDLQRFVDWRKREWWKLQDEFAYLMLFEWNHIEKLSVEVARYYGYSVQNFPRMKNDVLNFFAKADPEWRNLVMDVCIWVEYQNREVMPMREELHRFYEHVNWEVSNLDIDVRGFLEWREREYKKLIRDGRDWFDANLEDWDKLVLDIERFRAHAWIEADYAVVDFKEFWTHEHAAVPRLVDDVYRFTQWREREFRKFKDDVADTVLHHTTWEVDRLEDDLWRFRRFQLEQVPKLALEVDRFFSIYEREVRPLSEEVKRFWRSNIALGHLPFEDLKHFYEHSSEEVAELDMDLKRFIGYGGKEWADFKEHVKRFSTCAYDPAFGTPETPSEGVYPPAVMDDHAVVRDWDVNE